MSRLPSLRTALPVLLLLVLAGPARAQTALLISQYVETDSGTTPKGLELWNVSGATIDFAVTPLEILKGTNGGPLATDFTLSDGTLGAGEVLVVGTADIGTYLANNGLGTVRFEEEGFTFNGDDALQVQLGGTVEDTFGTPGVDPGSAWEGNGVSTANQNIALLEGITTGDADGFSDPSERFETVSTNPSGTGGLDGFGVAPGAMAPTTVRFTTPDASVSEGDGFTNQVALTNADGTQSVTVSITLDAAGSTNCTGADLSWPASVDLGPGDDTQDVLFSTTENAEQDGQKVCAFDLGESDPDVEVGTPSTFTLTIDDDDTPRLLVTEVMQNPAAVSDNDGEWFEVFNPNAAAIVLDGATVRDDGSNAFTVDDPSGADDYVVPPGGFFLFCDEPDPAVNGGVLGCDYDYAGFTLANGDDEIVIEQGGVEIARIAYDGGAVWPDPDGASMVYVGGRFGEDDDGTNWATAGAREQNAAGTAGFEDDPGGDLLPPGPTGDDGSPGLNGIHANLVSPFGVAVAAYCVATAGGSWSSAATWQNCSGGTPGAGDAAEIAGGTVTLSSPVGTVGAPVAVVVVDGGAALSVESDLYASVFTTAGATTVASVRGGGGSGLLVVGVDLSVSPSGSLTADGNVRLLPNSGNDACAADRADCVATITPEGGTTSGAVQMQREYVDIDADDPGAWRGIHAPLEGVPYADLADDFQVQGPDWSAFPDGTPNFYYYDNATEAFLPVGEGSGSATDPFDPDLGYLFYLFDFEVPGVWTVTGTPRESAPDLSLPYDAADANNFMWVGNVWAAPVDLVEQYAASTGIGATFRRFDPEVEGFAPYNAVTGVPGDSERYLAPFTSYVVQTTADGASLARSADVLDPGAQPVLVGRGADGAGGVAPFVQLALAGEDEAAGLGSPHTYLVFSDMAQDGADPADATLLYPLTGDFATLVLEDASGRELQMDARPRTLTAETFRARLVTSRAGTYTLSWPSLHALPAAWSLVLTDTETGDTVDLRQAQSYTFVVREAAAPPRPPAPTTLRAPDGIDRSDAARFTIAVTDGATTADEDGAAVGVFALGAAYPNPIRGRAVIPFTLPDALPVRVAVYDVLGREVAVLVDEPRPAGRHIAGLDAAGLAAGIYLIRLEAGTQTAVARVTVVR